MARYKWSDSFKGQWRSLRNGTGGNFGATYRAVRDARDERVAAEKQSQLEYHTLQWERKFKDGRSGDLKIRYNFDKGYTDIFFGGIGKPDGDGHGHVMIWVDGREQVVREPYLKGQPGGRKDATLLDDKTPDKRL
jgi:hypothetical protein